MVDGGGNGNDGGGIGGIGISVVGVVGVVVSGVVVSGSDVGGGTSYLVKANVKLECPMHYSHRRCIPACDVWVAIMELVACVGPLVCPCVVVQRAE